MSSFRFSSEANSDIEEIVSYIFDLNPPAAYRFLDQLEETCSLLSRHPHIGIARPELGENVRSVPIGNYLVFYRPVAEGIAVVRIIYGGRDLPGLFKNS